MIFGHAQFIGLYFVIATMLDICGKDKNMVPLLVNIIYTRGERQINEIS